MKAETVICEYQSEADARGHEQHRARFTGSSTEPRVMKAAADQCDKWGLPYSIFEVTEISDPDGRDEQSDPRGNLDDCLAIVEQYLLHRWEDGLGIPRGSFRCTL